MDRCLFISVLFYILAMGSVFAWDGYNDQGESVEIDSGNLVRPGNEIELYNYDTGEYSDVEVESINSYGTSVEIEVYDYSTGEYDTLEMDR